MSFHSNEVEELNPGHLADELDREVPGWRTREDWDYGYLHPVTRQFYVIEGAESDGYLYIDYKPSYSAAWLANGPLSPEEVQNGC